MISRRTTPRIRLTETLSPAESQELIRRWRTKGDVLARNRVVLAYRPLASSIAHRYAGARRSIDDAMQAALIGLFKACDRFDPDREVAFGYYATFWIRASVVQHLRDNMLVYDGSKRGRDLFLAAGKARARIEGRGEEATNEALAAELGVTTSQVDTVNQHIRGGTSLDDRCRHLGRVRDRYDVISARAYDPDTAADAQLTEKTRERELLSALYKAVSKLSAREKKIIQERWLTEGDNRVIGGLGKSLQTLGEEHGLSRERMRQIEGSALAKIKLAVEEAWLKWEGEDVRETG